MAVGVEAKAGVAAAIVMMVTIVVIRTIFIEISL